jgi:hypothetical protein
MELLIIVHKVQRAVFQLYSGRETKTTIYKNYFDWSTESMTFDCHCKSMKSWVGVSTLVFYSDYNAPTVFRNRKISCWEYHTYPLFSMVSLSII